MGLRGTPDLLNESQQLGSSGILWNGKRIGGRCLGRRRIGLWRVRLLRVRRGNDESSAKNQQ